MSDKELNQIRTIQYWLQAATQEQVHGVLYYALREFAKRTSAFEASSECATILVTPASKSEIIIKQFDANFLKECGIADAGQ